MKRSLLATFIACAITSTGWALEYDQITGWTTGAGGGLELGLRAVNRDNGSTINAEGFYAFATGVADSDDSKALWNFEFSIDETLPPSSTDYRETFNFYLGIDIDTSIGVNYQSYLLDPLTYPFAAGNTIDNADGHEIIRNSLNMASFLPFQYGSQEGTYDFRLFAVAKEMGNSPDPSLGGFDWPGANPNLPLVPVADVNIRVTVKSSTSVPDGGGTLAMLGLSLAGLAGISRRRIA